MIQVQDSVSPRSLPVLCIDQIPWLGTSYYLTATSTSPLYGRFADVFGRKYVFIIAIFLFESGSLIAGLAPNMIALIVGRAVCGLGGGGMNLLLVSF